MTLTFSYSRLGRFFSHFDPPPPLTPIPEEKFDVDKLYVNIWRVMAYIYPVTNAYNFLYSLFAWDVSMHCRGRGMRREWEEKREQEKREQEKREERGKHGVSLAAREERVACIATILSLPFN